MTRGVVRAVDTSVLVAAFASWHEQHAAARRALLAGPAQIAHCLVECYSVLTRLPAPHRADAGVAADYLARVLADDPLTPSPSRVAELPGRLARAGVTGGATYDALVAVTAAEAGAELLTLDARAARAYAAVGARHRLIG